jgi:hypothetical protein
MAQTLKFGNGTWATKKDSILAYNDENENYKPLPFNYTGAGKGTRVNKEGLIEVVENDRPRIDYKDSEDGVFLLEKAATNLVTYSEELSNWTQDGASTIDNSTISPDGTQNASKINFNSGNERIYVFFTTSNTSYSGFFRGVEGKKIKFRDNDNSEFTEITLTENWVRHEFYKSANNTNIQIQNVDADYVYAWGIQAESGNVASSYIPTQGSAQTRVAETANGSGNSEVFNDSEGVLFADISALNNDLTNRAITISDKTSNNRIFITYYAESNGLFSQILSNGVAQATLTAKLPSITNSTKVLVKYKQNDFALWVNGFEVSYDESGVTPIGLDDFSFDRGTGTLNFYGKTKEIGYYDTVLTDLELETLTSYRSWLSMVNELNLNVIYNG